MTTSQPLDWSALEPFQRVLLTTDGTVTDILSAYLGEAIKVRKLGQSTEVSERGVTLLNLLAGSGLMRRQIVLCGETSGQAYLFAESLIVPERLPSEICEGLTFSQRPVGMLMIDSRLETFREIVRTEKIIAGKRSNYLDCSTDNWLISRTYLVFASGEPVMQITEQFPETAFVGINTAVDSATDQ
tara:strand:- start:12633 stop:13190 length:558 start_codon:yes stop_codon:yes gene_type:complete